MLCCNHYIIAHFLFHSFLLCRIQLLFYASFWNRFFSFFSNPLSDGAIQWLKNGSKNRTVISILIMMTHSPYCWGRKKWRRRGGKKKNAHHHFFSSSATNSHLFFKQQPPKKDHFQFMFDSLKKWSLFLVEKASHRWRW